MSASSRMLMSTWLAAHFRRKGRLVLSADIDHLVLGPGGIVTINTKHHRGKKIWINDKGFLVSGHRHPYIRNSEFEAGRVTKLLHKRMPELAPAHPVLALVSPGPITVKKKPAVVSVMDATRLRRWLLKRPLTHLARRGGESRTRPARALGAARPRGGGPRRLRCAPPLQLVHRRRHRCSSDTSS
ncbi:NERD domain-containing protein [Cryobacterium frigoriphilum]|uniref:NERD domain-containing protein n=1 Tax=Cryobacterium frigoriphilum TaxID=1259150 RepID=A0A4R9A1G7_9MICO|nr:NERD domain-containing protein [Cryobacterium frigoriphilum]